MVSNTLFNIARAAVAMFDRVLFCFFFSEKI